MHFQLWLLCISDYTKPTLRSVQTWISKVFQCISKTHKPEFIFSDSEPNAAKLRARFLISYVDSQGSPGRASKKHRYTVEIMRLHKQCVCTSPKNMVVIKVSITTVMQSHP